MNNYFSEKELMCKCGCKTYNFDKDFLDKLNHIRYNVGQPLIVTSGCRCEEHNKKVGGTKESSHTKGLAVDIACSDSILRFKIIKQAINFGITRIGIGDTFIHLDVDPDKSQNVIWLY